jgi:hypothetical protein
LQTTHPASSLRHLGAVPHLSRLQSSKSSFDDSEIYRLWLSGVVFCGVRLSPHGTAATTGLLYQPRMIDDGDCGAISGIKIGKGNRSTPRKPAPFHFVNQKSHMTWPRLEPGPPRWETSDWAMARPQWCS